MTFLFDAELHRAISKIAGEDDAMCAVAFWGKGANDLMSTNAQARVICNLASGGTNPAVIESLVRSRTRQMDDLHAKVYIGKTEAVVTSANASINGLGLQGIEQAKWCEAGILTRDLEPLKRWFETLWDKQSRKITAKDIAAAKIAWNNRRIAKPSLLDFGNFDPEADRTPLISWFSPQSEIDWRTNEIEEQIGGEIDKKFQERLDNGIIIESDEDRLLLEDGRWVFVYTRRSVDGLVSKRAKPHWSFIQGTLKSAAIVDGAIVDWALRAEFMPPKPFEISPRFLTAFSTALSAPKYESIRRPDYDLPYFAQFEELMRELWKETLDRYRGGTR